MKPFLKQFVLGTCVMFTIFMTLSLPTAYYYAGLSGADTQGLTITLTLLVACIGFSFLQGFWFSGLSAATHRVRRHQRGHVVRLRLVRQLVPP